MLVGEGGEGGRTAATLFAGEFADDFLWEGEGHEAWFAGVPGGLGLAGVSEERGGDADFVEEVGFGVGVEGFAVFAEVEVDAVCAAVADAADGHYVAGVAGNAAVDVGVAFGLVLGGGG